MIKKIVLTAAVAAFAASFASAPAFAKKHHKMAKKCLAGHMTTGKPNSMGWAGLRSAAAVSTAKCIRCRRCATRRAACARANFLDLTISKPARRKSRGFFFGRSPVAGVLHRSPWLL
jgi:hypothetical protein